MQRISDFFGVPHEKLTAEGALDSFMAVDSRLHIDPHLLQPASTPELKNSYERFTDHFDKILHLLDASQLKSDVFFRQALGRLTFREIPYIALGYSVGHTRGKGIGKSIAMRLGETALQIVNVGINDPVIFELVGLFEDGVGADKISDMTASLILPNLCEFSERVARNLNLRTHDFKGPGRTYKLPLLISKGPPISLIPRILIPLEILRDLPMAYDWSGIDYVCRYNRELRERVNKIIGYTWRDATRQSVGKRKLKELLLANPDLLRDLIELYKAKPPEKYDFDRDPSGVLNWYSIAKKYAGDFPLKIDTGPRITTVEEVYRVVTTICKRFAGLVENNGLCEVFYDSGKLKHERFAHLLFYSIADVYCEANNLDVSREPNAGRGPVDFKVSKGHDAKVTVEVKYSSNRRLVHGFTTQLPTYSTSERTSHSIYLVIRTTESSGAIDSLLRLHNEEATKGDQIPEIMLVDGRIRPSASRA